VKVYLFDGKEPPVLLGVVFDTPLEPGNDFAGFVETTDLPRYPEMHVNIQLGCDFDNVVF
jgi:hypothetical protein